MDLDPGIRKQARELGLEPLVERVVAAEQARAADDHDVREQVRPDVHVAAVHRRLDQRRERLLGCWGWIERGFGGARGQGGVRAVVEQRL